MAMFLVPMVYWIWRGSPWFFTLGIVVAFALHAVAYSSLVNGRSWAWWVWLSGLVVCLAIAAPNVAYNAYLFAKDDPLYLDSPGTIIVVAVSAAVLVIPQLVSLVLLVACRAFRRFPWQAINNTLESDDAFKAPS
ncbi:MAG: hypothetical protein ACJ8MR_04755 [Povalibacter sp.]